MNWALDSLFLCSICQFPEFTDAEGFQNRDSEDKVFSIITLLTFGQRKRVNENEAAFDGGEHGDTGGSRINCVFSGIGNGRGM